MNSRYYIEQGELVIANTDSDIPIWRGKPDGYPVAEMIPIEGGCIVLLDPASGPNRFNNLIRFRGNGSASWKAELPTSTGADAFTSIEISARGLEAYTWSGFTLLIDGKTGNAISSEFTK
jgi:hypothetical protein